MAKAVLLLAIASHALQQIDRRRVIAGALLPVAKARAAEGKGLSGSANRSKAQLLLLYKQVEERAAGYSTKALHKRKATGLWQRLRAMRVTHDAQRTNVAASHVSERRVTEGGRFEFGRVAFV